MHLNIKKEKLLDLLSSISSTIERRHTLSILTNIKFDLSPEQIQITGSDLEVELICTAQLKPGECITPGSITIPARKLLDICKALPAQNMIDIQLTDGDKCILKSKHSKFVLGTLPSTDYPLLSNRIHSNEQNNAVVIHVQESELKRILDKTAFAMAVQDVRFYLTGTLLEIHNNILRAVCTDGHRLALCEAYAESDNSEMRQAILPRKAVSELQKIGNQNQNITLTLGRELITVILQRKREDFEYDLQITSKLIDGKYPDYQRIMPKDQNKIAKVDTDTLKQALQRVSILSNEKLKSALLTFDSESIRLSANNPDQDEATEDFAIEFNSDDFEIAANIQYMVEALGAISNPSIEIHMTSDKFPMTIRNPNDPSQIYIIMPMRI